MPSYFDMSDFARPSFRAYFSSRRISTVDIREILGPDWIPGVFILVGNDPDPLLDHDEGQIHNGSLVRIAGLHRRPAFDGFGEQLRLPYIWARDVDAVGMPYQRRPISWMSIHGLWGDDTTCPNFANLGGRDLRRRVAELCGLDPEHFRLQHPAANIWNWLFEDGQLPNR